MNNEYRHSAGIKEDDGGPVVFLWHWPKRTFDKRMSAFEIASFVIPHMPNIVPLLAHHPRAQSHFQAMLVRLSTWPKSALDELLTWIKPEIGTGEDDLIRMEIACVAPQPRGTLYSLPGGGA